MSEHTRVARPDGFYVILKHSKLMKPALFCSVADAEPFLAENCEFSFYNDYNHASKCLKQRLDLLKQQPEPPTPKKTPAPPRKNPPTTQAQLQLQHQQPMVIQQPRARIGTVPAMAGTVTMAAANQQHLASANHATAPPALMGRATRSGNSYTGAPVQQPSRKKQKIDERKPPKIPSYLKDFDSRVESLERFQEEYGDTDVPYRRGLYKTANGKVLDLNKYYGLGFWCQQVRRQLKIYHLSPEASTLTKEQANQLRFADFCLEPVRGVNGNVKPVWDQDMFEELELFYKEYKHSYVPPIPASALRKWLDRVQGAYHDMKAGRSWTITEEEIAKMEALDFDWNHKSRYTWEERAHQWLQFRAKHPGEDPPHSGLQHETGLRCWVTKARRDYRAFLAGQPSSLKQDQIDMLTNWGFDWKEDTEVKPRRPKSKTFDERLEDLWQYKKEHGDCMVPQIYPGLGFWVSA